MIATPATDPSVAAPLAPMKTPAPAAINGAARPPVSPVSKHRACLDQIVAYSLQSDAIGKKTDRDHEAYISARDDLHHSEVTRRRSEYQVSLPPHSAYIETQCLKGVGRWRVGESVAAAAAVCSVD